MTLRRRKALLEAINDAGLHHLAGAIKSGDRRGWAILFADLKEIEGEGLITVERKAGKIGSLILTEQGVRALDELRRRV